MRTFSRSRTFSFALAVIAVIAGGTLGSATVHAQTTGKPMTTPSGLQIIDTKVGAGASPKTGQTCVMHYTGWLYENGAKGKKFDSSVDRGTAVRVSDRDAPRDRRLGRRRRHDEGRRQAQAHHSAAARLRRARRRQRHSPERHADLRCRAHRHQGLAAARFARNADPRTTGKSANPLPDSAALNPGRCRGCSPFRCAPSATGPAPSAAK
jgi:hypothetical protein